MTQNPKLASACTNCFSPRPTKKSRALQKSRGIRLIKGYKAAWIFDRLIKQRYEQRDSQFWGTMLFELKLRQHLIPSCRSPHEAILYTRNWLYWPDLIEGTRVIYCADKSTTDKKASDLPPPASSPAVDAETNVPPEPEQKRDDDALAKVRGALAALVNKVVATSQAPAPADSTTPMSSEGTHHSDQEKDALPRRFKYKENDRVIITESGKVGVVTKIDQTDPDGRVYIIGEGPLSERYTETELRSQAGGGEDQKQDDEAAEGDENPIIEAEIRKAEWEAGGAPQLVEDAQPKDGTTGVVVRQRDEKFTFRYTSDGKTRHFSCVRKCLCVELKHDSDQWRVIRTQDGQETGIPYGKFKGSEYSDSILQVQGTDVEASFGEIVTAIEPSKGGNWIRCDKGWLPTGYGEDEYRRVDDFRLVGNTGRKLVQRGDKRGRSGWLMRYGITRWWRKAPE